MASIYQLNQPPNPFWDFVNGNLEDHPFFAPRGHHGQGHHGHRGQHHDSPPQYSAGENNEAGGRSEFSASDSDNLDQRHRCNNCGKGKGKGRGHHGPGSFRGKGGKGKHGHGHHGMKGLQSGVKDTQDADARTADEHADPSSPMDANEASSSESEGLNNLRRDGNFKNKGRGPGHHGHGSGPLRSKGGKGKRGHGPPGPHSAGAFGWGPGNHGMHGMGKHGHGPHHGPHGFHDHHGRHGHAGPFGFGPRGHRGPGGHNHRGPPGGPFEFLRQIGAGLGLPMNKPTEGDFTPSVDVFDTPTKYIVHASLPGAKKSDLSIDYDAEESVLHLAGVVYRPGVNEDLHQALVMEERGQEIGVFEREVRFGTRIAPAFVIVDGISAKLEDGVLNVTLPKIVQDPQVQVKKKVLVESGEAEEDPMVLEKTLTPVESEGSEYEGEAREYVKVAVQ